VRRLLLVAGIVAAVLVVLLAAYELVFKDTMVTPHLIGSSPVAVIGSGEDAIAVAADGSLLRWFPLSEDDSLPQLPLQEPPKGGRLRGTVLEQAKVLAATPPALRQYVESSHYGESGVDVVLDTGIELRFGDDSQATRKWKAAAAVLADPEVEALDYVDLSAPGRPASYGSGHSLPPAP
jgi:cell division septal protein FtsQ